MSILPDRPLLTVYSRASCHLCDELRGELQALLDERARRGQVVPRVAELDVDADPDLRARYGGLVPVLAIGGQELPLVMSGRQARAFLERALAGSA